MAAWASREGSTPGPGSVRQPCGFAKVMVPVLSSSRVRTSPAASTARPDFGDHVQLHQPVHAGDADGGEQAPRWSGSG